LLAEMEADLARLRERWPLMTWPGLRPWRRPVELPGTWAPRADVYEQNGNLVVKAELPGVDKNDVDVAVEGGDLVIRGERREEHEIKEEDYYRMERSVGSFYRRLPLPEGIKADQVAASFADGVLEVRVPKPATVETKATKIAIK
jgi:HSP20 family protein